MIDSFEAPSKPVEISIIESLENEVSALRRENNRFRKALRSIIKDFDDHEGSGKGASRMVRTAREVLGLEWDEVSDTWKEK